MVRIIIFLLLAGFGETQALLIVIRWGKGDSCLHTCLFGGKMMDLIS